MSTESESQPTDDFDTGKDPLYDVGSKHRCIFPGDQGGDLFECRVERVRRDARGKQWVYFIHFMGWTKRYDCWMTHRELTVGNQANLSLNGEMKDLEKLEKKRKRGNNKSLPIISPEKSTESNSTCSSKNVALITTMQGRVLNENVPKETRDRGIGLAQSTASITTVPVTSVSEAQALDHQYQGHMSPTTLATKSAEPNLSIERVSTSSYPMIDEPRCLELSESVNTIEDEAITRSLAEKEEAKRLLAEKKEAKRLKDNDVKRQKRAMEKEMKENRLKQKRQKLEDSEIVEKETLQTQSVATMAGSVEPVKLDDLASANVPAFLPHSSSCMISMENSVSFVERPTSESDVPLEYAFSDSVNDSVCTSRLLHTASNQPITFKTSVHENAIKWINNGQENSPRTDVLPVPIIEGEEEAVMSLAAPSSPEQQQMISTTAADTATRVTGGETQTLGASYDLIMQRPQPKFDPDVVLSVYSFERTPSGNQEQQQQQQDQFGPEDPSSAPPHSLLHCKVNTALLQYVSDELTLIRGASVLQMQDSGPNHSSGFESDDNRGDGSRKMLLKLPRPGSQNVASILRLVEEELIGHCSYDETQTLVLRELEAAFCSFLPSTLLYVEEEPQCQALCAYLVKHVRCSSDEEKNGQAAGDTVKDLDTSLLAHVYGASHLLRFLLMLQHRPDPNDSAKVANDPDHDPKSINMPSVALRELFEEVIDAIFDYLRRNRDDLLSNEALGLGPSEAQDEGESLECSTTFPSNTFLRSIQVDPCLLAGLV
jgi:hypothetical protein